MKYLCDQCKTLAVWNYAPGSGDTYCCDSCVPRGCSCNLDEDNIEPLDDLGREYPCCEWDYNPKGFIVYRE